MNLERTQARLRVMAGGGPRRTATDILCTLGPASLDRRTIQRLELSGATLFRINLSHTKLADLPRIIHKIGRAHV